MIRRLIFAAILALLLAGALSVSAQTPALEARQQRMEQRQARREQAQQRAPANNGNPGERGMMGLPPKWIERLQDMPPAQQERFLRNNQQFQSLPPWRQQQIRQNLAKWNNLSPEQREEIRQRERIWEQMTPEQQDYVRNVLLPRWQQLPLERRAVIQQHLRALNGLSDSDREARLNNPRFLQGMSPDEQQMLRDLAHLRIGAGVEPPPQ
ncbi:MAG: DUF3106 domain-containing protein [Candidatus Acidiferrales bacterium]